MTKINRSILALIMVMVFCFSAMPAYAAEISPADETTTSQNTRATIFNAADYLSSTGTNRYYTFTVPSTGTYTITIVVDAMGGDGAYISLHKLTASTDTFSQTFTGRFQDRIWLTAGTYEMSVTALDQLSFSVMITN